MGEGGKLDFGLVLLPCGGSTACQTQPRLEVVYQTCRDSRRREGGGGGGHGGVRKGSLMSVFGSDKQAFWQISRLEAGIELIDNVIVFTHIRP